MLDQQVVRAALKAFDAVVTKKTRGVHELTPSTAYLRHLVSSKSSPSTPSLKWHDPQSVVSLLEKRAAATVQERAKHLHDPDASVDQRVSRAVTDAFVAAQVGDFVKSLEETVGGKEAVVLRKLYNLVRSPFGAPHVSVLLTETHSTC